MVNTYCTFCGREYRQEQDDPWRCECKSPLQLLIETSDSNQPEFGDINQDKGLWAFDDLIPIEQRVSFGEGFVPEVYSDQLGVSFTLEYVSPTGSFKDRGTTTMLSRALNSGVKKIVDDSSGNAGSSIATYAAHKDLPTEIYVPADTSKPKINSIERVDATVVTVEGPRNKATRACMDAANEEEVWYANHRWRPSFLAGTKTWAFEIAARRAWNSPDAVVIPIGAGSLFLGAYRGFSELSEMGWIDEMPRIYGAEATGYSAIADQLHDSSQNKNIIAEGLHIRDLARPEEIAGAIQTTSSDVIAVDQTETENALNSLHTQGFYVEPTASVALAAFEHFLDEGVIERSEDVVVPLCGSGLNHW